MTLKPSLTTTDIKHLITAAFVEVDGPKVTLSGKVRSFAEQDDAINGVWSAPGINEVENHMELEDSVYAW